MPQSFYARRSLNIEVYGARTADLAVVAGDADFYIDLARKRGGPSLELGCGTGRLLFPLARAGIEVTGLDRSAAMLAEARRQLKAEPQETRELVTLKRGDMTKFSLDQEFGLVFIAFRSFMMLDSPKLQRACLECAFRHLMPGGTLAVNLFDPLLDRLVPSEGESGWEPYGESIHPETWNIVKVEVSGRDNDPVAQVFEETWRFTEIGPDGIERVEEEVLRMRWTYRNEMRYLLELCGFEIVAEYSDYAKSPPAYGKEQIWVARKPLT